MSTNKLAKDKWIQEAKALLFDCIFCVDSKGIKKEIDALIEVGGGYDPIGRDDSPKTKLRWPGEN